MNWKILIDELKAAGLGQQQIATACGCGQATISGLYIGTTKQPNYALGVALTALHRKHARKIKTAA